MHNSKVLLEVIS